MKGKRLLLCWGLLSFYAATLLAGCKDVVLFNPKGPIGQAELLVIIIAIGLMLLVLIPVFIMAFWFPRKYRASNTRATYMPKWSYSLKIDLAMWAVPIAIVIGLGILAYSKTHQLDPYAPIDTSVKPLHIEVVSMDWKWLFIYPEQDIASVNQLVFPAKVPLSFKLTSDAVLASFFIPQLGSQIYAKAGMMARLHLLADATGTYTGQNNQFSGRGYADMHFKAIAVSPEAFQAWVQKVKQSPKKLDLKEYRQVAKPSAKYPVTYFSSVKPGLFLHIIRKYDPTFGTDPHSKKRKFVSTSAKTSIAEEN